MKTMTTVVLLTVCIAWAQSYDELLARARSALAGRNYREVVTASQQAIQMNEQRWEAYAIAANGYSGQQFYDDAIGMLQMALPRAPEDKKQLVRDALQQVRRQMSAPAASAPPPPPSASAAPATTQQEIILWKSIENSRNADDFRGYLDRYRTARIRRWRACDWSRSVKNRSA